MFQHFRTLRFRLTLLYVVVFGLIQAGLWIAVDLVRTRYLYRAFDWDLVARAQTMAEAVAAQGLDPADPTRRAQLETILAPFGASGAFAIRLADGRSALDHSAAGPTAAALPAPAALPQAPGAVELATIRAPAAAGRPAEPLRVATLAAAGPNGSTYYVQLAASRRPVQEIVAQLRRMLVSFVLISLAAAALTSWYLARRSLAPLGEVVRQARALGASRLEERLPVPRSGDEVAEMVVVVNEMLARLEAEFRNQQRFIADVSHELRTPVAVLLGEAQALKRRVGDPAVCQVFAGTVEEEARRLLRTVEAFLVLTRVRAGGRPPVLRDVSMEETVLNAVQKAQAEARARQVTILPRFSSSETSSEPHVAGDPELLYALVVNLLRHAIQHSPARAAVEVEVLATTRDLTLHVRDSGPPIPPEQLLRIFDLLRRVRPGADGGVDTGVGLAVVKGVAQLYGGSTEVRNRNDGGCEFTVRLPLTARTQTGAAR